MKKSILAVNGKIFMILWVWSLFQPCVSHGQDMNKESYRVKNDSQIEAITVTAQKQEENIQEVSMGISAFTGQAIEDATIRSIVDVADYTPNLTVYKQAFADWNTPSMRGISAPGETLSVSTGLYLDGVPVLSTLGYEDSMLDVERVEVLRGPQGTLYGKNTEVGCINIITRQPDNQFRGKVAADAGTFLSTETGDGLGESFAVNLSGPLSKDRLFAGLAGQFQEQQGFVENINSGDTANDRQKWYGRGHLRWTPMDRLDISFIGSYMEYDNDGPNMAMSEFGAKMYGLSPNEYRQESSNIESYNDSTINSQSLKIKYGVKEEMTVTSITARRVFKDVKMTDFDFSPMTRFHSTTDNQFENFSQELRLNYAKDRLKWLLGLYYDKDYAEMRGEAMSDFPSMNTILSRDLDSESYAAFANLTYPLFRQFNLVTGLRYEYQKGEMEDNTYRWQDDNTWESISPKLALEYIFSSAITSYVSVSKGFRSGGFNRYAMNPQYYAYNEEELWSYEVGLKSAFLENRFIVNSAVYYMDIEDMQVNEAISLKETYITNAAEATGYGFEIEATAKICDELTLMSGFGFNHVEFDKFEDTKGDYSGNKNPYAPEYTFNIGVQYRDHNGLFFRTDLIGKDKMYLDKGNTHTCDAHEIVNVKIGYETERFDIYIYGRNIFDERYDMVGAGGGYYTYYSDPGKVGLTLNCRF